MPHSHYLRSEWQKPLDPDEFNRPYCKRYSAVTGRGGDSPGRRTLPEQHRILLTPGVRHMGAADFGLRPFVVIKSRGRGIYCCCNRGKAYAWGFAAGIVWADTPDLYLPSAARRREVVGTQLLPVGRNCWPAGGGPRPSLPDQRLLVFGEAGTVLLQPAVERAPI